MLSFLQLLLLAQLSWPITFSQDFLFFIKPGIKTRVYMHNHCPAGAGAGKSEDQCHPGLHDEPLSQKKQQRFKLNLLNHCFPLKAPVYRKTHWKMQKAFLSLFPTLLSRINLCFVCLIYRVLCREPRVSGEKGGAFCLPHCQHSSVMGLSGKKRMSGNE